MSQTEVRKPMSVLDVELANERELRRALDGMVWRAIHHGDPGHAGKNMETLASLLRRYADWVDHQSY